MKSLVKSLCASAVMCLAMGVAQAADVLLPFSLAYKTTGDVAKTVDEVKGTSIN